jgi:hypothetical protein
MKPWYKFVVRISKPVLADMGTRVFQDSELSVTLGGCPAENTDDFLRETDCPRRLFDGNDTHCVAGRLSLSLSHVCLVHFGAELRMDSDAPSLQTSVEHSSFVWKESNGLKVGFFGHVCPRL